MVETILEQASTPVMSSEVANPLREKLSLLQPVALQAVMAGELMRFMEGKEGPAWTFVKFVGKTAAKNLVNAHNLLWS